MSSLVPSSIRLPEEVHKAVTAKAKSVGMTFNKYVAEALCDFGDIRQTNDNDKIQLRINFTYISDLMTMDRQRSVSAIVEMMIDAMENKQEVIFEKHFNNYPPIFMKQFESVQEIQEWYKKITLLNDSLK